jgi:hypothetical protein
MQNADELAKGAVVLMVLEAMKGGGRADGDTFSMAAISAQARASTKLPI